MATNRERAEAWADLRDAVYDMLAIPVFYGLAVMLIRKVKSYAKTE